MYQPIRVVVSHSLEVSNQKENPSMSIMQVWYLRALIERKGGERLALVVVAGLLNFRRGEIGVWLFELCAAFKLHVAEPSTLACEDKVANAVAEVGADQRLTSRIFWQDLDLAVVEGKASDSDADVDGSDVRIMVYAQIGATRKIAFHFLAPGICCFSANSCPRVIPGSEGKILLGPEYGPGQDNVGPQLFEKLHGVLLALPRGKIVLEVGTNKYTTKAYLCQYKHTQNYLI